MTYFTTLRIIGALVVGMLLAFQTPLASQTPSAGRGPDQEVIAKRMLSEDKQERDEAFAAARAIRPSATGPALRAALIALLERQNQTVKQARDSGMPPGDPESRAELQHMVAGLRDPNSIPALAGALGMFTAIRALARFGEQAVPAVVGVVTSPQSRYSAVNDGLRILRFIVEQRGIRFPRAAFRRSAARPSSA